MANDGSDQVISIKFQKDKVDLSGDTCVACQNNIDVGSTIKEGKDFAEMENTGGKTQCSVGGSDGNGYDARQASSYVTISD